MTDVNCATMPYIFMKCGSALTNVFFARFMVLVALSEAQQDSETLDTFSPTWSCLEFPLHVEQGRHARSGLDHAGRLSRPDWIFIWRQHKERKKRI